MPTFATDTVHGLSADVYYNSVAVRVFGDCVVKNALETLPLTANDEGNVNPVKVLRRGETVTVTIPIADATGFATISGIVNPFASGIAPASGNSNGTSIVLPKAVPGDNFLTKTHELRLVLRDGSATWIFPAAVVTEIDDLTLSEENQMVQGATFTCFRTTISGIETPYRIYSGSVVSGGV